MSGQYLVSGSDDGSLRVWEVDTGRCLKTWDMGGVVRSVSWCPNSALSLVAVAVDTKLYLINTGVGDKLVNARWDWNIFLTSQFDCGVRTDELLGTEPDNTGHQAPIRVSTAVKWSNGEEGPPGTLTKSSQQISVFETHLFRYSRDDQPLQVSEAGDLARQGRLLRHGDAGGRQQISHDSSAVKVEITGTRDSP